MMCFVAILFFWIIWLKTLLGIVLLLCVFVLFLLNIVSKFYHKSNAIRTTINTSAYFFSCIGIAVLISLFMPDQKIILKYNYVHTFISISTIVVGLLEYYIRVCGRIKKQLIMFYLLFR